MFSKKQVTITVDRIVYSGKSSILVEIGNEQIWLRKGKVQIAPMDEAVQITMPHKYYRKKFPHHKDIS